MLDTIEDIEPLDILPFKLNGLEKFFVACAGYKPVDVERNTKHREELRKLVLTGGAVLFATSVAATNWYVFGDAHLSEHNPMVAGIAAAFGAATVLFIDKAFLYSMDTQNSSTSQLKTSSLTVVRIATSLLIASLTSQTALSMVMEKDLSATAFAMRMEQRDAELAKDPYHVNTQQAIVQGQNQQVSQLQQAVSTLPDYIQGEEKATDSCWQKYNARKQVLRKHGLKKVERKELAGKAAHCESLNSRAKEDKDVYLKNAQQTLTAAHSQLDEMTSSLTQAQQAKNKALAEIDSQTKQSYTPTSNLVMARLMKDSSEARYKRYMISSVIAILEMLPYLLKCFGQSVVGRRIGSKELIQTKQLANEEAKELQHLDIEGALRQASTDATVEGLAHPMMKEVFLQSFMAIIQAYAPFEAVQAMMRELEKSAYNVNTFQQRFPDYSEVIGMAWHRAIQQACDILSTPKSSASAV